MQRVYLWGLYRVARLYYKIYYLIKWGRPSKVREKIRLEAARNQRLANIGYGSSEALKRHS